MPQIVVIAKAVGSVLVVPAAERQWPLESGYDRLIRVGSEASGLAGSDYSKAVSLEEGCQVIEAGRP